MKKITLLLICFIAIQTKAQVNIGANTAPNANAMVEISGSTKGLLLPRIALTSTSSFAPLSAHVAGMAIYNTATAGVSPNNVVPGYYYNDGTQWIRLLNQSSDGTEWYLTGTATDAGNNKTSDIFRNGSVGIGISPASKLDVAAGTTTVNTVINGTGAINDYLQFNIQNTSTGTQAQSGYAATADNGSATTGFAWMGINNSNFNYPTTYNIGGANDVSFLGSGQDMYIANAHNTKSIIFSTGKAASPYFNERMRITNGGLVGIGTATPTNKLQVYETTGTAPSGSAGSIFLEHGNSGGQSSIVFKSTVNANSDFGYISYSDDGSGNGSTNENSLLEIGVQNDISGSVYEDDIALMPSGNVGIGTRAPANKLEITHGTAGNSGLRFTNLTNAPLLATNASGNVISAPLNTANGLFWGLTGNATTTSTINFIGTTDGQDFVTKTNNIERMRIASGGYVGVGTSTPLALLDVAANTTTVNNIINATGSINDYLEFNVQNTSTGIQAQSGYNATADNGSTTSGFVWMGINNSTFNYPTTYNIGGANDVSFLGSGQDMYIANAHNTKSIIFSTGKAASPYFNERMRITNSGFLGIGTTSPNAKLDLTGIKSTGSGTGTGASNDGPSQVIITAGSNGTSRLNDWPSGWGGGLSVYDVCGAGTFFNTYVTRSDIRLKKDINSMSDQITTNLLKLRPVTYLMKEQIKESEGLQYGFIAQEVKVLFPSIITESSDPNGIIGMNYQALIAPAIYVIQQQQVNIEKLQSEMELVKIQNDNLQKVMTEIEKLKAQLKSLQANSK